ncbi:MAG: lamin tail domain-containing protein [Bacilli bacterium]|nr:lamin tail domain-containing protein [Bacilli bacterium]
MNFQFTFKKLFLVILFAFLAIGVVGCQSNEEAEAFAQKLYIQESDEIVGSFPLPKFVQGNQEVTVTWASDNEDVVVIDEYPDWDTNFNHDLYYRALVTLPAEETDVVLTATVKYGKQTATRPMTITVVADEYTPMTVAQMKQSTTLKDAKVRIEGTIVHAIGKSLIIADETGYIFAYVAAEARAVGDIVVMRGEKDVYNNMPQFAYGATSEKVSQEAEGFDPFEEAEAITIDQIMAHDVDDAEFYSTPYLLTGKVEASSDANNPYRFVDPTDPTKFIGITKYTVNPTGVFTESDLPDIAGKYVEAEVFIYNSYQGAFSVVYVDDSAVEKTAPELTEQQKLNLVVNALHEEFDDTVVSENITLPTTGEYEATVGWVSGNAAYIANDGTYTAPIGEDVFVDFTVTVQVGTTTETITITMKAIKAPVAAQDHIVISQAYGGGGSTGAAVKNDFVELFNPTNEAVDLTGWVLFYASATGLFKNQADYTYGVSVALTGSIAARSFYLVQLGGGTDGVETPTPDATGTITMSGTAFKLALCNSDVVPVNVDDANVVDFLAVGTTNIFEGANSAPVLTPTTSAIRTNLIDTDNNNIDFTTTDQIVPRNSATDPVPGGADSHVVISQAYGGGGNTGATLKSDFIELYNPTNEAVDLTGWVLFYASLTGDFKNQADYTYGVSVELTGSIAAKGFYLIKMADGAGGTVDLPTPDVTGTVTMNGTGFKLALCNSSVVPTAVDSSNIVDFVGSGPTASLFEGSAPAVAPSNTTSIVRTDLSDTDDNAADFSVATEITPRNSAYVPAE